LLNLELAVSTRVLQLLNLDGEVVSPTLYLGLSIVVVLVFSIFLALCCPRNRVIPRPDSAAFLLGGDSYRDDLEGGTCSQEGLTYIWPEDGEINQI
jgi:hypothetical protein